VIRHDPTPDGRPFCRVCGEGIALPHLNYSAEVIGAMRCHRHATRNPCAIEGCQRSTAVVSGCLRDDQWICSEHWRRYVPPRSKRRQAYHSFFRKAKRHGWSKDLRKRFWRFWDTLVASARARHDAGTVDVTEINRIMGW
jgi:hypothetical protein